MAGHPGIQAGLPAATMSGQDAFGAIREIVRMLDADPKTDWSKVDIEALRQHLIDMSEVTLKANATAKPIDGLETTVTGSDRRRLPCFGRPDARECCSLTGYQAERGGRYLISILSSVTQPQI